jgi:Asp-tRNA(Asn)/Glu-tRNA(Gln) amidotransferase A subunit family amidase
LVHLRRGDTTIETYATALADRIDQIEPFVKAWTWYDRARFVDVARRADHQRRATEHPDQLGDMFGIPVAVKDIFNTEDMPTSHGSVLFKDYMAGNDARVVTNLRRSGALIQGKTATAEFAVHYPTETRNPIAPDRAIGTSSGGSAAAVAGFMTPIALASQTAASAIRPASYAGVVGFKPSFGLLPRTAMLKTTDTLDTVALMARCVDDIALAFETMRVRGPNYPIVDREMNNPIRQSVKGRPWRVGILQGPKSVLESSAVKSAIEVIAQKLATFGCVVESIRLPADFDHAHEVHETIYRRALAYYFRMEWSRGKVAFSSVLSGMVSEGLKISSEEYHRACAEQTRLSHVLDSLLKSVDVILCPAAADEAPIGLAAPDTPDHTLIWTMCLTPTLTVPVLRGSSNLPVGLQVISRRFNDSLVFQFAKLVEQLHK